METIIQNIKAILFVLTVPVILAVCFHQDQIGLDKMKRTTVECRNK